MKRIMKLNARSLGYAALFAALIAVLVFLILQTQTSHFARYDGIIKILRDLKQADANWDTNILRTRTGEDANYDQVTGSLLAITALQDKLGQESRAYWRQTSNADALQRIKPSQDKLADLLRQKAEIVQDFESHNAILRNSSNFLPTAATQLEQAAAADDAADKLSAAARSKLGQLINGLLADAMNYLQMPNDDLYARLMQTIDSIDGMTQARSEAVAQAGGTLVGHANAMLAQRKAIDDLLTQLTALPVAPAIDALTDAQARENQRVVAVVQQYQRGLDVYIALLVLLFLAWRVVVNFRTLGRANAELEHVNADLARANREIRESQVHLIQAEKMSSLGQMVAGIAHEINTPLAYVKGTFSVLKQQLQLFDNLAVSGYGLSHAMRSSQRDQNQIDQHFHAIESAARTVIERNVVGEINTLLADGIHGIEQISDIVANLRNFSRLDREKVTDFSVEQGLDSTLLLARNLLKNAVKVRREYGHVPQITGSPSQINQVFLNIITNAVHAMPAPGSRPTPNIITLRTRMENQETVRIDIEDNGAGIPADVLPKIFDPFFTTKPIGQGTGMGLSISYKIVQEHGGRILVDSRKDAGAVFSILLPAGRAQNGASPAIAEDPPAIAWEDDAAKTAATPLAPLPAVTGESALFVD